MAKSNVQDSVRKKLHLKLELSLHSRMLQKNGVINVTGGKDSSSYYITYPDISVKGTAEENGNSTEVYGIAWYDHQFGNFRIFDSARD